MSAQPEREDPARQEQTQDEARRRSRAANTLALRAVVAAYLVYLGGSLIYDKITGKADIPVAVAWLAGLLFIVCGLFFAVYTWRRWRALQAPEQEAAEQPSEDNEAT